IWLARSFRDLSHVIESISIGALASAPYRAVIQFNDRRPSYSRRERSAQSDRRVTGRRSSRRRKTGAGGVGTSAVATDNRDSRSGRRPDAPGTALTSNPAKRAEAVAARSARRP